ncbi:uncharacterized protein [Montipora foliosa]|uniref:uncharacterized protein n=1 Tax=Montipora foliosa TaxID=591990 RepID=UPI0035F114C1
MIVFLIYVLAISAGKVTTQTEFSEEAFPEIEFQPIAERALNESTVREVSARPLPAEPLNPQVVISENETGIKPSQNVSSVSVPPVHRRPLPVGGTSLGNETQIPESPLIEPECHKALDLGFLMDSSYTISPSLWEQEKSMVVTLLDKMDVSPLGTHMSVMTFSTEVEFPIPFNGYNDVDDLKRKITVLPYHTGWSRTDLGLTAVKERMFDHHAGARDAKRVPRALVVFTNGKTDGSSDQNLNWTQMVSEAADDLKHANIKVFCVEIGDALLQDMTQIASDSSSVFSQTNLDGVLKELVDMGAETCSSEDYPETTPLPSPYMMYPPTPAPYFAPHPAQYPTPQPAVNQLAQYPAAAAAVPAGSCQIPQCTYPSICITAAIYQTCIAPTTTVPPNSTCATPGQCLTTRTIIATDTTTVTDTKTQTHVLTNTHYTTKTSTALLTSHVPVTTTKTLTTTSVGVVNATNTQTLTSTAVVMSSAIETSTAVVTSTSHSTETSTAVETSTAIATSTAVVTATTTSTNIAKSTQVATSTKVTTATSTLITTSTGVTTSTHVTTATNTNTVNTTHFATETLTKTLTTTATHRTTITHNSTNLITATATSTAIATSTALLTSTSIAKTTETLTATSTAIQTQTLTNTINQILTQTQTLTATSTAVVTTCSFNCSTIGPTPSFSSTPPPEAESSASITTPPPPTPPECKRALDLGLVIDSSDSIHLENYQLCLDFVSNLTTSFMVSKSATHFGAIVFSSTPILQFNFADARYYKRERLREAIKNFTHIAEGTRTDLALSLASKELFSIQGGDRPSVPNVLIVITDGRTNPQSSRPYPKVLQPLKKKNVTILAVGVGAQVDRTELITIALNDSNHVFMVERYKDLTQILKSLSEESCNETLIAHPPTLEPAPFLFSSPTNENLLQPLKSDQQVQPKVGLYGNCPVHFTKKGCFNDLRNPRPLRKLMFTDLDENAVKYSGFPVDWGRFDSYLEDVACRCAQVSKAKGFTHFGIEDFGECWSGKDSERVYNKDGLSRFCITKQFAQCNANDRNACSGNKTTIFVYSIPENYEAQQDKACFTQYKNIGCYADKQLSPRPIPDLIFTDLDKDSPKYSGNEARLGELDTYLSDVLCRCAEQAQELGYKFFGVQNHGECYSGPKVEISYDKDGPSNQCITRNFRECDRGNLGNPKDCVGTQGANYVYRIIGVKS